MSVCQTVGMSWKEENSHWKRCFNRYNALIVGGIKVRNGAIIGADDTLLSMVST